MYQFLQDRNLPKTGTAQSKVSQMQAGDDSPRASTTQKRTRIQREKHELILDAALEVFAKHGFRGATLDQIADQANLSKPNLLYYFKNKEAMHRQLLDSLLDNWLVPLKELNPDGDPIAEIKSYIRRKLELARDYPRESRLFANEVLQGAPRIQPELAELKELVDHKVVLLRKWMDEGRLAKCDPYHLIFSIWATTQHYADFDAQVRVVLGDVGKGDGRFEDAARFLDRLFVDGLKP